MFQADVFSQLFKAGIDLFCDDHRPVTSTGAADSKGQLFFSLIFIKRDQIFKPNDFFCKKVLALLLIVIFIIYTNCSQQIVRTSHKGALFTCSAEYVQGSTGIPLGRGGILVLLNESINYEYEDITLQIHYQNILDIEYSQNIKNIIGKFPGPNYGYYEKQDWGGPSFLRALLFYGSLAIVLVIVVLLLQKKPGSTYMTISYTMNGQTEWSTFKIRTSDINKLMPLLNEKIDIY